MTTSATNNDLSVRAFQGSSTTRVRAILYPNSNAYAYDIKERDPRRLDVIRPLELDGATEHSDAPAIVAATVETSLVTGDGGVWQLVLRAPGAYNIKLLQSVAANDWVDIAFIRQGQEWHVMRGIVDSNSTHQRIANGATSYEFVLTGRSFLKPILISPIWFDMYTGDSTEFAALRVLLDSSHQEALATPEQFVKLLIFSYYEELVRSGRAKWRTPDGMPGEVDADDWLTADAMYDSSGFTNFPPRLALTLPNLARLENTTLWQVARQWADLPMCELFADLAPAALPPERAALVDVGVGADFEFESSSYASAVRRPRYFQQMEPVPIGSAQTRVIFRDCPFPSPTRDGSIEQAAWFNTVALFETNREGVTEMHLSKSDTERMNAFYVAPQMVQELGAIGTALAGALWDPEDVSTAGLRRMDVFSRYVGDPRGPDGLLLPRAYRKVIRDFFCLNHLFLSGEIRLAPGRPDVRIGSRFRVRGPTPDEDVTTYVQAVRHEWTLPGGLRTTLGVSRGWIGTDESLWTTLTNYVNKYEQVEIDTSSSASVAYQSQAPSTPHTPAPGARPPEELRYAPDEARTIDLFREAAAIAGVPEEWATDPALHALLGLESGGWVGRPTARLARKRGYSPMDYSGWVAIHNEFKALPLNKTQPADWVLKSHTTDRNRWDSTATGLGQLLLFRVDQFYPGATNAERRAGIGVPLSEAVGMLKYIQAIHTTPAQALGAWNTRDGY